MKTTYNFNNDDKVVKPISKVECFIQALEELKRTYENFEDIIQDVLYKQGLQSRTTKEALTYNIKQIETGIKLALTDRTNFSTLPSLSKELRKNVSLLEKLFD